MKHLGIFLASLACCFLIGASWKTKRVSVADCTNQSAYASYVSTAMGSWNEAGVVRLYKAACDGRADINIYLDYYEYPPIADTSFTRDSRDNITKATIRLNRNIFDLDWTHGVYTQYVTAHEMGHALGLGHNQVVPSVMSLTDGETYLPSYLDLQNLRNLYRNK